MLAPFFALPVEGAVAAGHVGEAAGPARRRCAVAGGTGPSCSPAGYEEVFRPR
jgi:hypothetical protein